MSLHLLTLATNYKGTPSALPDCELDARNWQKLLSPWCATVTTLRGRNFTKERLMETGKKWLANFGPKDAGIVINSTHGTREKMGGKWVEAVVFNDFSLEYDFEMAGLFSHRPYSNLIVWLADCCHSGTIHRGNPALARSIPLSRCKPHAAKVGKTVRALPNVILYTGCEEGTGKYSYSTGTGGAMSLSAQKTVREFGIEASFKRIYRGIREQLPSDEWPQTPQFHASEKNARKTLKSFVEAA